MRFFLILLVLLIGAGVALWQFDVVDVSTLNLPDIPFINQQSDSDKQTEDLFSLAKNDDTTLLTQKLESGASVNVKDAYGQTPLMYAATSASNPEVITLLLAAGADINAQTDTGWTALMYAARDNQNPEMILTLMNAGADPTLRNDEGQTAADLARTNPVMSTNLYNRLEALAERPFNPDWPSGYVVPVEGATLSSRSSHLPGAARYYRNGTHEGFDFYSGVVSVAITYGTPIHAVATGKVIRADHDYVEMSIDEYNQVIDTAKRNLSTPPEILDKLRGRQVWVEHPGGFISRYAHLSAIPDSVQVGNIIKQGDVVGETGNSGTLEAAQDTQDDPHPHVEIWNQDTYLGKGMEPDEIYTLAQQVFGPEAMPPYTE